ncbi:hypothetical protein SDD30_07090 [Moorella naiadis]|uniref:hypothetical protein n=1 Tax=Moorella naiadis (nom. illeg.) TaxID=3093670 RepID=UPI003D9CBA4E
MLFDRESLLNRRKQWERFNAWEVKRVKALLATYEPVQALDWFGAAWELARKLNPDWSKARIDMKKIQRIQKGRTVLAQVRSHFEGFIDGRS